MHIAGGVTTVATTYGALFLGTCFACILTGVVLVQCILYFKLYPNDSVWTKGLVCTVWTLDIMHTICIVTAVWHSVIDHFDQPQFLDVIPTGLGLAVLVTAAMTFVVHSFFANRIRMLMKKWYIAAPLMFLAFSRLVLTCVSTSELIHLKRYSLSIRPYPSGVFTASFALSALVEFTITTTMILFLRSRKTGFANMDRTINTLILFTLETGGVAFLVTITSFICYILMRHNLIFFGMYFVLAKLYANSLLAALIMRKRPRIDPMYPMELDNPNVLIPMGNPVTHKKHFVHRMLAPPTRQKSVRLNVNVETTVVSQTDQDKQRNGVMPPLIGAPTVTLFDQGGNNKIVDRDSMCTNTTEKDWPIP